MDLRGKRVIVTGGTGGLGRSLVDALLARGAAVSVFDIDAPGLRALEAELKGVHCIECDVASPEQVVDATARHHQTFGAPDVLINNAGILFSAPLLRFTPSGVERHDVAMWNRVLAVDLGSVFHMTACVAEQMVAARRAGVVVNISSVMAAGNAGQSAYSAAKAGVNALTATWAKELGPLGIRVVAVAPGVIDTASTAAVMREAVLREIVARIPLRRLGTPAEIAHGVLSVIENDLFNGKVFALDGGLTL